MNNQWQTTDVKPGTKTMEEWIKEHTQPKPPDFSFAAHLRQIKDLVASLGKNSGLALDVVVVVADPVAQVEAARTTTAAQPSISLPPKPPVSSSENAKDLADILRLLYSVTADVSALRKDIQKLERFLPGDHNEALPVKVQIGETTAPPDTTEPEEPCVGQLVNYYPAHPQPPAPAVAFKAIVRWVNQNNTVDLIVIGRKSADCVANVPVWPSDQLRPATHCCRLLTKVIDLNV